VEKLARLLGRRPRTWLAVLSLATLAAAAGIPQVRFDSSLESLTVPDDPARAFYAEIKEVFGSEEIGVVLLLHDDVYEPEVLEGLRDLADKIGHVEGVEKALSLASAKDPAADVLTPPPLMPRGAVTAASAAKLRERVAANPIYIPHLVSESAKALGINIFFTLDPKGQEQERIDGEISAYIDAYDGPAEIYYTGVSHIRVQAVRAMRGDLLRFLPLSLLGMMLVLWAAFRSLRAIVLPLASIAIGVAALLGMMGWLSAPITLPTLVLPTLLLVIGGSYSIHVTGTILDLGGKRGDEGMAAVIGKVGLPISVSALTTAVGFGSLALHPIPAIARLGMFAVVGIVIMAIGGLFGLPLAFFSLPEFARPSQKVSRTKDGVPWIDRLATWIAAIGVDHRSWVFAVALFLGLGAAMGAARIQVDTDFLSAFREDSDVSVANRKVSEHLAGANPISVIITGPVEGYFRSIVPLRQVREFQSFLEETEGVDATISLVDYLEELDLGLQAAGDGDFTVNDAGELVEKGSAPSFWDAPREQLPEIFELVALSPDTFSGVVDRDFRRLRITVRTSVSGSLATKALVSDILAYSGTVFPVGVVVQPTGNPVVVAEVSDRVLSGQIESLLLAFAVILGVLTVLFLSLRVAVAAMLPNVLPVLLFFGVMGWSGVALNIATSIIAAVALGIAVDDTIHYMAHLARVVKTAPTQREALLATMDEVGRPVIATSFTLTAGFLVMLMSDFALISQFGWLSAMTMLTAMAANLILLPALLANVPVISVWDLVAKSLGPSPQKTISLFHGLNGLAVRLVVLMGTLRSYQDGDRIVERGQPGREMYLVLEGEAEVRGTDGETVLAALRRGDVLGEMALLRSAVRSADVVASGAVEVLVIDEAFLRRLRGRYPRFASRFFLNIARILSDRLEDANRRLGVID
jgi:predicted RND superfamily exporter protein